MMFSGEMLDAVQDPLICLDTEWRVTWANRALERYAGFGRAVFIGKQIWQALPMLKGGRLESELTRAMADRVAVAFEVEAPFRPGEVLQINAQSIEGGLAMTIRNVTRSLQTEAAARTRLIELETIYDSAPIGLALIDADLRYVRVNRALAHLNGAPAEDHIGRSVRDIIPASVVEVLEPVFRQVLGSGVPVMDLEIGAESPAMPGVERTWLESIAPVRGPDGAVRQIQVTMVEITEHKASEARLAAALEQRRQAYDQLAAREAELRRSEHRRRELLSEMNHRVKNNFQMVASLLDLQARRSAEPQVREQLMSAVRRVRVLAGLHSALTPDPDVDEIEFGAYLAGLCDKLRASVEDPTRVSLRFEGESARLPSDAAVPMGFVVNELVTNAIKYAFPAGASGQVVVRFGPAPAGFHLSVADDGQGLPLDPDGQGGGLGMRLVRAFIAQAGGQLAVSTEGGTRYDIRLPGRPV